MKIETDEQLGIKKVSDMNLIMIQYQALILKEYLRHIKDQPIDENGLQLHQEKIAFFYKHWFFSIFVFCQQSIHKNKFEWFKLKEIDI